MCRCIYVVLRMVNGQHTQSHNLQRVSRELSQLAISSSTPWHFAYLRRWEFLQHLRLSNWPTTNWQTTPLPKFDLHHPTSARTTGSGGSYIQTPIISIGNKLINPIVGLYIISHYEGFPFLKVRWPSQCHIWLTSKLPYLPCPNKVK